MKRMIRKWMNRGENKDKQCKKIDKAIKSYYITMINLISPTRPQTPPGIESPKSKGKEVVSTDDLLY